VTFTGDGGNVDFGNAQNWSDGTVPDEAQVASIGAAFPEVTIGFQETQDVGGLILANGVSLVIGDDAGLLIGSGSGNGTASITNHGTIEFGSANYAATFKVDAKQVELGGGGVLQMLVQNDQSANDIQANTSGETLDNINNTIEGAGTIGGNSLTVINGSKGVIDANASQSLIFVAGSTVMNSGLLESTVAPTGNGLVGLILDDTIESSGDGRIEAAGGNVLLEGGTLVGGTISTSEGAILAVTVAGDGMLDGSGEAVINTGQIVVAGENTLTLQGQLENDGTLTLSQNQFGNAGLSIGSAAGAPGTVTLSGAGTLLLTESTGNYVFAGASGDALVNDELITGSGTIGNATNLIVTNDGTIDSIGTLSLVLDSQGLLTNTGLLETTSVPAGSSLTGLTIEQAVDNDGGMIAARGGDVLLERGSVAGGTISSSGTNQVQVTVGGNFTLDGGTQAIANTGELAVEGANTLSLIGSLANSGTLSLDNNRFGNAILEIGPTSGQAGTLTLSGGGTLLLDDTVSASNTIQAQLSGSTLDNIDNMIEGAGSIGANSLTVINSATGVIDANASDSLVFVAGSAIINRGLLESTTPPNQTGLNGLVLEGAVDNGAVGRIAASGGNVMLEGGTVIGGTISTSHGAIFAITVAGDGTLDGTTNAVTNTGQIQVEGANTLTLLGELKNDGTLSLNQNIFGNATLSIGPATGGPGTVTLSGRGTLLLTESSGNYIVAGAVGNALVNDQLLTGSGTIGSGTNLLVTNDGTIDATGTLSLILDSTGLLTNDGLLETTSVPADNALVGLTIEQSVDNDNGVIAATGGNVLLEGGSIAGGTISSAGTNSVDVTAGGRFTLDGSSQAIANTGQLAVQGDNTLTLLGSLVNSGTFSLDTNQFGDAVLAIGPAGGQVGTVTLSGTGTLSLSDSSGNEIVANSAGSLLLNGGTLAGAGQIGAGTDLNFTNNSVVEATGANALIIDSTGNIANDGLLEATDAGGGGLLADGSITNDGVISAAGGNVTLAALSGAGTLMAEAGSTLDLTAGGTLSGVVSGAGTLQLDGATPFILPNNDLAIAAVLIDAGVTLSGSGSLTGAVSNQGTIIASAGTLTLGAPLGGTGNFYIGDGATGGLGSSVGEGQTISFGSDATLNLADPTDFAGTLSNFGPGDAIVLTEIPYDPAGTAILAGDEVLQVTENGTLYDLQLSGDFTGEYFQLSADGAGSEITVDGTPCYCRGTLILTETGEIAVEELKIGDRLITHSGQARPIRWIGRRFYNGRFVAGNREILPIFIRQGALGENVPHRDLAVSPLHAMFLDGVLIPAAALVNGISIVQAENVEMVEYFHIELETHDIIIAEGAAAESFVDDDSRGMFHNAADYAALYPQVARQPAQYCAPRLDDGDRLEAISARILARARRSAPAIHGALRGHLDLLEHDLIAGWAFEEAAPDEPVRLRILADGRVLGEVIANQHRADLQEAGFGDGNHGFSLSVEGGLPPEKGVRIAIERAADDAALPGSPFLLHPHRPGLLVVPSGRPAEWRGHLDTATNDRISGWAWDETQPHLRMRLQILVDGEPVARVVANRYRRDLAEAGIGDGRHGFSIAIPGGLSPLSRHVVQVLGEADGAEIAQSPRVIEPAAGFDNALEQAVGSAIAAVAGEAQTAQAHVLDFLAAQADRLRQLRANADSQAEARLLDRQLRHGKRAAARPDRCREDQAKPGLRALVIDDDMPDASRDAGSQAILSHMRALRGLGYGIVFAAGVDAAPNPIALAALEADGVDVARAPFYATVEEVLRRQAGCFDLIYLHRVSNASKYLALARQHCPGARIVFAVADLHHVRLARQAEVESRPELLAQSRRVRLAECTAALLADAVITHSAVEADWLRRAVPDTKIHVVPWEVPEQTGSAEWADRRGLAFIANFAHGPNVDAAHHLVEDIMPLVWRHQQGIECRLVGSAMPASITQLARPGIVVTGHVANLTDILDSVRLTVAPLRYGAGIKGKVLNSLAAGVPCVMTPVAAEGIVMGAPPPFFVGETASDIAVQIAALHGDRTLWQAASDAGRALIRTRYSAAQVAARLAAVAGLPPLQQQTRRASMA
jgi:glycosyltransferase involved in cell wall biosynthesis